MPSYLINFIDYLNHETNDFDTRSSDEKREKKPLSDVYKEALFARVMVALNKAERKTATAYFPTFLTVKSKPPQMIARVIVMY